MAGPNQIYRLPGRLLAFVLGAVMVGALTLWGIQIQRIRSVMGEIKKVEGKLASGQELWRRYPPLDPREREALRATQERLLRMLPDDKDLPTLLEQVSQLTREYNLSEVSLHTDEFQSTAASSSVAVSAAVQKAQPQGEGNAVTSYPVKLSFAGDFRETAYFLEALQNLPRLIRVESVKLQRGVPLVASEVSWKAYYKNEDVLVISP